MGLFSWRCRGCRHSIREPHTGPKWMNNGIALFDQRGERHRRREPYAAFYDGYGRLEGGGSHGYGVLELTGRGRPPFDLWHYWCWKASGHPPFRAPAVSAPDQGHFFRDAREQYEENLEAPNTKADVAALRAASVKIDHGEPFQRVHATRAPPDPSIVEGKIKCPNCGSKNTSTKMVMEDGELVYGDLWCYKCSNSRGNEWWRIPDARLRVVPKAAGKASGQRR